MAALWPCVDSHFCESLGEDVQQLSRADAERLLGFVAEAQALDGPEPFSTELLDELGDVMESEFASYYSFGRPYRGQYGHTVCSSEARYVARLPVERKPAATEPIALPNAEQPNYVGFWSDVFDRASRRRFETTPSAKVFEVVDCAWTLFPFGANQTAVLCFHRNDRDFTDGDRRRVRALRPHVAALIRDAHARRRLDALLKAANSLETSERRGFVLLSGPLEVEHASHAARRLLTAWFGSRDGGHLPLLVHEWLRSESRREPLRLDAGAKRLVVEAPTNGVLVLTEEAVVPASLTVRELDVLRGLAAGKSTAEVACDLWVTRATVSKHLEHIYRKLGVSSRTAALAAVGATTDSLDVDGTGSTVRA